MELEGVGTDVALLADDTVIRSLFAYFGYQKDVQVFLRIDT